LALKENISFYVQCWADTYMLVLEVILGITVGKCKKAHTRFEVDR